MRYNEIMSRAAEIMGTQLTNALRALNVNFIMGGGALALLGSPRLTVDRGDRQGIESRCRASSP
jgi:hypothetical protein